MVCVSICVFACTPAQAKTDIRTAVDDVSKACQAQIPQSVAILIDPTTGETIQIACVDEEALAQLVDRVLSERRAKIRARMGVPSPSASA